MHPEAPRLRARSSLPSFDEVMMTLAPARSANCNANIDTPPVPSRRTDSPGDTRPKSTSERQAVTPAQGSAAAPTHDRCSGTARSEEHTSELQSHSDLVCRLLLEKKKKVSRATRPATNA